MNLATVAWYQMLDRVLHEGTRETSRGLNHTEVLPHEVGVNQFVCDMKDPVIQDKNRKLNYHLMAREALWMMEGRNDVFDPRYDQFSDDGETLAGAYGPKIQNQLGYVLAQLTADHGTRQAVISLWEPNPPASKDIPCTTAMIFHIREGVLYMTAFMRSSDVWLGIPYDAFSFSLIGYQVMTRLRQLTMFEKLKLGFLSIIPASSHVYESDRPKTLAVLDNQGANLLQDTQMPEKYLTEVRGTAPMKEQLGHAGYGGLVSWKFWE